MKDTPDPQRHPRGSIRLPGYDYTQPGAYFVTVVAWQRACLFGEIVEGQMRLNPAGEIAREEWFKTADLRGNVRLHVDEFVVMPNHIHGVIWITDQIVGAQRRCAPTENRAMEDHAHAKKRSPISVSAGGLGAIVRGYKSAVTYRLNALRGTPGMPVWQRNYYEHIIRDESELTRVRAYILDNPSRWEGDREYHLLKGNP